MKNVVVRSLSGIVYIALIVVAILAGGWWFFALAALLTTGATLEYQHLVSERQQQALPWSVRALDMCAVLLLVVSGAFCAYLDHGLEAGAVTMLMYFLLRLCITLVQKEGDAFACVASSILGVFYIGLPLSLLTYFVMAFPYARLLALAMFVLIWLNDTGAFCFGCTLGKHRLCERLSPKKSWEGFWGGALVTIAAGCAIGACVPVHDWLGENTLTCTTLVICGGIFGIVVCLASTWGDLFESLLKRSAHVKDAGHIIPGHGGILDRIDSLLFVVPATAIFMVLFTLIV